MLKPDYLLPSSLSRELYEAIKDLPVVDYFSRLTPAQLGTKSYQHINELWLQDDPLKTKFLKSGNLEGVELFQAWANDLQHQLLHPIYALTHVEMMEFWGLDSFLKPANAPQLYDQLNAVIKDKANSPAYYIQKAHVSELHYLADPVDTLPTAEMLTHLGIPIKPVFAPIKAFIVDDPLVFNEYMDQLAASGGFQLEHYIDLLNALQYSMDTFGEHGCRLAHHRLELMYAEEFTQEQVNFIFHKIRLGHELFPQEKAKFRSALLSHLTEMYDDRNWIQQFHLGTIRQLKGMETGFDAMGDDETAWYLLRYLHEMTRRGKLPKTIFHHPYKTKLLASIGSKFHGILPPGWIQVRPGWEILTNREELVSQIRESSFPSMGGAFPGLPSSACVWPSLSRHDYFKRVMSYLLAEEVLVGSLPQDMGLLVGWLANMISGGHKKYFG